MNNFNTLTYANKNNIIVSSKISKQRDNTVLQLILFYVFIIVAIILTDKGISLARVIAFWGILFIAVLQKPISIFMFMVATLPLSHIARMENSSLTLLPFLTIILLIKIIITNKAISLNKAMPLFIIGIISIINEIIRWSSMITSLVFIMTWLIPVFAYCIKQEINHKIVLISFAYVISSFISIIGSTLFPNAARMITSYTQYSYRAVGFSQAWSYGINLVIASAFILIIYKQTNKRLVLSAIAIAILLYNAILSGTFSILIGIALVLFCFSIQTLKKEKVLLLLLIPLLFVLGYSIMKAFFQIRGDISDNGRIEIWMFYMKHLLSNFSVFMFGIGGGNIASMASKYQMSTAHNGILELLIEVGFCGTVLLILYSKNLLRNIKLSFRKNILSLPFLIYLSFLLTQGGASSYSIVIFISLLISSSEQTKNQGVEQYVCK
ncbi:MAG TPA: hypothetical protein PK733_07830 [Clostridiales bacterium]|nr:hypothetical protein [Clostridiales bacterium]